MHTQKHSAIGNNTLPGKRKTSGCRAATWTGIKKDPVSPAPTKNEQRDQNPNPSTPPPTKKKVVSVTLES